LNHQNSDLYSKRQLEKEMNQNMINQLEEISISDMTD